MPKRARAGRTTRRTLNTRIAIPIPYLDRNRRELEAGKREQWRKEVHRVLTECFGGATSMPAPGTFVVETPEGLLQVWDELDQWLVVSYCRREEFLGKRDLLSDLAERMRVGLDQHSVLICVDKSSSFLVEGQSEQRKRAIHRDRSQR